jgi:hypothetical protein
MKINMRSAMLAGAVAVLLSACGGSPTSSRSIDPAGPSYDGGFTMGSGNRTAPTDTSSTGPQSTAATGPEAIGVGN